MAKSGEIVSIHTGEAGIKMGNATWELYCIEHGIRPDGVVCNDQDPAALNTFFTFSSSGKCVPRAIFTDTDSCIVDDLRTGVFRFLYNPKQLISGKEDASNCFAKGYISVGREMLDSILERVRISAEECSRLQGFVIYRAVGGGTGSGMTCYLLEYLASEYKKKSKIDVVVYPSPKLSSIVVEPYNALLATHSAMSTVSCALMFDNDAVYDICDHELDISSPTFKNVNRVIGQVMSAVTAQFRFEGENNVNIADFQTNLVPYPRIHFPVIGYAPFLRPDKSLHENNTVSAITNSCFDPANQMMKCNTRNGKYVSCCLLYRGDVTNSEINSTLQAIKGKRTVKFVSWLPAKFKVGVNYMPPVTVPGGDIALVNRACVMIGNNTAIQTGFERLTRKYDLMYSKKAFIHWFVTEGLEESDFLDTRMDIEALIEDYKEVESEN